MLQHYPNLLTNQAPPPLTEDEFSHLPSVTVSHAALGMSAWWRYWTSNSQMVSVRRKSQSEWQRTEINGESISMVWPTLGSRTAELNRTIVMNGVCISMPRLSIMWATTASCISSFITLAQMCYWCSQNESESSSLIGNYVAPSIIIRFFGLLTAEVSVLHGNKRNMRWFSIFCVA